MKENKSFQFRGVQLDLARQRESVQFIKQYIDLISINGYNVLFLYLEGIIRTKSFPSPDTKSSYSAEQMKEIVAYAASRNIDVIPGLACLGHAEHFLKYPEFADTAELRDGAVGRFVTNTKDAFCPSQKSTRRFLENYISDICTIFPSQYIHVGLDEIWDIGFCEECKGRAASYESEQQLFLEHVLFLHEVVTEKFQRRMMMWDDMFEYYPDILEKTPRDIVMVNWQYQDDVAHNRAHFFNRAVTHRLAIYERLGFQYIIAPSDYSTANIRTFTEYARKYHPLGGLVTVWEKGSIFMYKSMPTITYAGHLWSGSCNEDEKRIFDDTIAELMGSKDELLLKVLRCFTESRLFRENMLSARDLLCRPFSGFDYSRFESVSLQYQAFQKTGHTITTKLGCLIYKDILLACNFIMLYFQIKKSIHDLFVAERYTHAERQLELLTADLETLGKSRVEMWDACRSGIAPNTVAKTYEEAIAATCEIRNCVKNNGVLRVRFCLPDQYSAETCVISIRYGKEWEQIADGVFKNNENHEEAIYEHLFFVDKNKTPEALRFEVRGFGGQGICFAEVFNANGHYTPNELTSTEGMILSPESILDDDIGCCFMGEPNTRKAYQNRKLAQERHKLEVSLRSFDKFQA
jgi:hypothetical protein